MLTGEFEISDEEGDGLADAGDDLGEYCEYDAEDSFIIIVVHY